LHRATQEWFLPQALREPDDETAIRRQLEARLPRRYWSRVGFDLGAGTVRLGKPPMRVLLAEDDEMLAEATVRSLTADGFSVDHVETASDALHLWRGMPYGLAVLDVMLPDGNGFALVARARALKLATPTLMLTALGEVQDRVAGLNAGADDYLVKPFAMAELIARLRALLRRPGAVLGAALEAGDLRFDTATRAVSVADRTLSLTRAESITLERLMRGIERIVSKEQIAEAVYALHEDYSDNAVEVHVHRLRRKLEAAGARCRIMTLRGLGYMLTPGA